MSATRASNAQRRVAAREDQPEPVVGDRAHVALVASERLELGEPGLRLGLLAERPLASQPVDRPVARRRRDPRAGVVGDPRSGHIRSACDERLLDRVLGQVEVAEDADQGRDRPPLLLAEQAVDDALRSRSLLARASLVVEEHQRPDLDRAPRRSASSSSPRSPRPGPCTRPGSSRPAAPWSRRTGRRWSPVVPARPRTVVASEVGCSASPPRYHPLSCSNWV